MSVLKEICEKKILDIQSLKSKTSESKLLELIKNKDKTKGFKKAINKKISKNKFALIAEIKRASPSKGIIKEDFVPINIATSYKNGGATCLSILTEENWFKGKNSYLIEVRNEIDLPILRKDFILDPWQVLETRYIGADCILIILSAVNDQLANELKVTAKNVGLDILVEVHNEEEVERAIKLSPDLIGINNRNLKTLEIDLNNTIRLANLIPKEYDIVCESGLSNNDDLKKMSKIGINTFLVGESLMKNNNIEDATKKLLRQ
tara:strand:- start:987 stop:1775 length:789 start_codon:yes stop_codon:yes gene_type:complete